MGSLFAWYLALNPLLGISLTATLLSFVFALIYRLTVDVERMKKLKKKSRELRKRMDEARRRENHKELKDLWEKSMKLTHEQFAIGLKPMMLTLLLVMIVFPFLKKTYNGATFALPFSLPFIGNDVGWLGLYIIISIPTSMLFRKLLKVE